MSDASKVEVGLLYELLTQNPAALDSDTEVLNKALDVIGFITGEITACSAPWTKSNVGCRLLPPSEAFALVQFHVKKCMELDMAPPPEEVTEHKPFDELLSRLRFIVLLCRFSPDKYVKVTGAIVRSAEQFSRLNRGVSAIVLNTCDLNNGKELGTTLFNEAVLRFTEALFEETCTL